MPDLSISELNTGTLDVRDSSLAHAIVDGVLCRWLTLEYILNSLSGRVLKEQEPRMQAALLCGSAQLLLLDRVPPHAVIDETVEWAKKRIRPRAGGMVNAILRKVAKCKLEPVEAWDHHLDSIPMPNGSALLLDGIELPENGRERLVLACSLPTQLIRRWEKVFQDPTSQALHTLVAPPTILNTEWNVDESAIEGFQSHASHGHHVFSGRRSELIELLEENEEIWVQDPASSSVLNTLNLEDSPQLIVDMCAGQGTKTRQLRKMFPESTIIASDIDAKRLSTLSHVFRNDEHVQIIHGKKLAKHHELKGNGADFILIDVPCSNTGVLPRRREARYRPMRQQLARICPTQQEILQNASLLLKKGGMLRYSTCSIEQDENEDQVIYAQDQLDLKLCDQKNTIPNGLPGGDPHLYHDGSFAATLKK